MNFDLKWGHCSKEIDFKNLKPNQCVNYFNNTGAITTKTGLYRTLQALPWWCAGEPDALEVDEFFPKCYDPHTDYDMFFEQYIQILAESFLKMYISRTSLFN